MNRINDNGISIWGCIVMYSTMMKQRRIKPGGAADHRMQELQKRYYAGERFLNKQDKDAKNIQ